MVAEHLLQLSASLTAQELMHKSDHIGDFVLDITKPIRASYTKIDGRTYVKHLRNAAEAETETNKGPQSWLAVPFAREAGEEHETGGQNLFVAEDHLGIRRVFFVSPKHRKAWCCNPPGLPGAWWKRLSISREGAFLTVVIRSDVSESLSHAVSMPRQRQGFKMREIRTMRKGTLSDPSRIGWQVPAASYPPVIDLLTLRMPRKYPNGFRMRFFDCNTPDVTGYSVATSGSDIFAILSHKQNETSNDKDLRWNRNPRKE